MIGYYKEEKRMERKLILSLGPNSYSNIEYNSKDAFTEEDWIIITKDVMRAKAILDGTTQKVTKEYKARTEAQANLIGELCQLGKSYETLVMEYVKELGLAENEMMSTKDAHILIDLLKAKKEDDKVEAPKVTDANIDDGSYPDFVIEQMPTSCKKCGEHTIRVIKDIDGKDIWWEYKCESCGESHGFANEPVGATPVKVKELQPTNESTSNTPPKFTSKDGVPEWAMKEFMGKYADVSMGREFEYIEQEKSGDTKYFFKSKDGVGMYGGKYYVNAPVQNTTTKYDL